MVDARRTPAAGVALRSGPARSRGTGAGSPAAPRSRQTIRFARWWVGSSSRSTRRRIKGLTQFGDRRAGHASAIATRSTGSKRSSRATAARTPSASPTCIRPPRRAIRNAPQRGAAAAGAAGSAAARARRRRRRRPVRGAAGWRGRRRAAGGGGAGGWTRRRPDASVRWPRRCATAQGGSTLYGNRGRTGVINRIGATRSDAPPTRRDPRRSSSTRNRRRRTIRRASARTCTARRSARRIRTRCTSSARTWTATAGAKPRMTTARARRS